MRSKLIGMGMVVTLPHSRIAVAVVYCWVLNAKQWWLVQ